MQDVCSSVNYVFKSEISYFMLIGSQWIFQGPTLEIVFLCCFLWIGLNRSLLDLFWMKTYIWYFRDPLSYRSSFKLKKQPFRVFRGPCQISSFFAKKVCFSVFVLNSVEDKDSRFISCFKLKEKSFCVYRGQWEILIILPKTRGFFGFHCW